MAEAILNHRGKGAFTAYSAGSRPSGVPRPEALKQIESAGISTDGLRSKSWDEFAAPGAAKMDFVFTVCDNAAKETCPFWPGQPMTAHWGIPDPAAVTGTPEEIARAFNDAFVDARSQDRSVPVAASAVSSAVRNSAQDRRDWAVMRPAFSRRLTAEFVGTLLLLAAVVGSGIMGERLAGGNVAIALLANTLATGAALVAIILAFGPVSGAHLNPAVTLADAWLGGIAWREVPGYIVAQVGGAIAGVSTAHAMFGLPVYAVSTHARSGTEPGIQRVCCHVRAAGCDLGMRSIAAGGSAVRGGGLHHGRVLVHSFNFVRKSCRDTGAVAHEHLFGHTAGRCAGLHLRSVGRRVLRYGTL